MYIRKQMRLWNRLPRVYRKIFFFYPFCFLFGWKTFLRSNTQDGKIMIFDSNFKGVPLKKNKLWGVNRFRVLIHLRTSAYSEDTDEPVCRRSLRSPTTCTIAQAKWRHRVKCLFMMIAALHISKLMR